ncbi:MAG TPA: hypothetical protein VH186_06340 [Chloroflexia bacterium]|nr:hypothetical protein [Chloroflexia bacterium]
MNNLAINIQHTPRRDRWTKALVSLIEDSRVTVVTDETNNLWNGAQQTLTTYTKAHTHMLVLQDDILPCKDLIKTAEQLIELLPDKFITLFSNKNIILQARAEYKSWALVNKFLMAQAYIMPIPMIEDFLPWATTHIKPQIYFDDDRLGMYLYYHNLKAYATSPSLVEHLGWNQSTLSGYKPEHRFLPELRMAKYFIGFEQSGLSVDWTKGLADPVPDTEQIIGDWSHFYLE